MSLELVDHLGQEEFIRLKMLLDAGKSIYGKSKTQQLKTQSIPAPRSLKDLSIISRCCYNLTNKEAIELLQDTPFRIALICILPRLNWVIF